MDSSILPSQPGDIIRNRKDGVDYVIESLTTLAIGGGILLYAVNLVTRQLKEFHFSNSAWINNEFVVIRHNMGNKSAQQVVTTLDQHIESLFANNKELITRLQLPENAILKDLVFLSADINEVTFQRGILDIAAALVNPLKGMPSKAAISSFIKNAARDTSLGDEWLELLIDNIHRAAQSVEHSRPHYSSSSALVRDILINSYTNGKGFGDLGIVRKFGLSTLKEGREKATFEQKQILDLILGDLAGREYHLDAVPFYRDLVGLPRTTRLQTLSRMMFQRLGGNGSDVAINHLAADFKATTKAFEEGDTTPLSRFFLSAFDVHSTDFGDFGRAAQSLQRRLQKESQLVKLRREPYGYLGHQYFRRGSIVPEMSVESMRSVPKWEDLLNPRKLPPTRKGQQALLSIDLPTFLDHLLGDAKVTLTGKKSEIASRALDKNTLAKIRERFGGDISVFMTPKQLAEVLQARERGEVIDLGSIIESHKLIKSQVGASGIAQTHLLHGEHTFGRFNYNGQRVGVGYFSGDLSTQKMNLSTSQLLNEALTPSQRMIGATGLNAVPKNTSRLYFIRDNSGRTYGSTNLESLNDYAKSLHIGYEEAASSMEFTQEELERDMSLRYMDLSSEQKAKLNLDGGVIRLPDEFRLNTPSKSVLPDDLVRLHSGKYNLRTVEGVLASLKERYTAGENVAGSINNLRFRAPSKNVEQRFALGLSKQTIAIAQIKKPGENSITKLIGSQLGESIEQQRDLGLMMLHSNKVGFVDIETKATDELKTNRKSLSQLHLGIKNGDTLEDALHLVGLSKPEDQALAIIDFAKKIKGLDVIASHGQFDPHALLAEAEILLSEVGPARRRQLETAMKGIQLALETKWLNLQVYHQIAGSMLGDTGQPLLTRQFLKREEQHTARADNIDAFQLAQMRAEDYKTNAESMEFTHGSMTEKNLVFFDNNTLSPQTGRVRKLHGLYHGSEGVTAQWEDMDFINGKLKGTGRFYGDTYGSVDLLGANLERHSIKMDLNNTSQYYEDYMNRINDSAARRSRAVLNPHTRSLDDATRGFNPEIEGLSNTLQFGVERRATELYQSVDELYEQLNSQWAVKNKRTLGLENMDVMLRNMDIAIRRKIGPSNRKDWVFGERLHRQLMNMMLNSSERARLMSPDSSHARLLHSTLGNMIESTRLEEAAGAAHSSSIFALMVNYGIAETEKVNPGSMTSILKYGPRIGFELGGLHTSASFARGLEDVEFIGQAINSLASEAIMKITDENKVGPIHDLMARHGIDAEKLTTVVNAYRERKQIARWDLQAWKEALTDIALRTDDPDFGMLAHVREVLAHGHEMAESVKSSLHEVREKQRQIVEVSNTAEEMNKLGLMDKLISDVEEHVSSGKRLTESVKLAFSDQLRDDELGTFKSLFTQEYQQFDINKILDHFGPDQTGVVKTMANAIREHYMGEGELNEVDLVDDLKAAFARTQEAYDSGVRGIELQSVASSHIVEMMAAHKNAAATAAGAATISEKEIQHRLVTKAAKVVGTPSERELQHRILLTSSRQGSANGLKNIHVPLLAIAGAAALMAANSPESDSFTQGPISDQHKFLNASAQYSEIPGTTAFPRVWTGQQDPFQLDITFTGFVNSKHHHDELTKQVFDTISNQMEFKTKTTDVQDFRDKNHRQKARDLLRANL